MATDREIIVAALSGYRFVPPGLKEAFFLTEHGRRLAIAIEWYVDPKSIRRASLELMQAHTALFEGAKLESVTGTLRDYLKENAADLGVFRSLAFHQNQRTLGELVTPTEIDALTSGLVPFMASEWEEKLFLVPINRVSAFESRADAEFCVLQGNQNCLSILARFGVPTQGLDMGLSPPHDLSGRQIPVMPRDCWIGCLARSDESANSKLDAAFGALLVVSDPDRSHYFSGDLPLFGIATLARDGQVTFTTKRRFPTLLNENQLGQNELERLFALLDGRGLVANMARRLRLALELVGVGWQLGGRQAFVHNAMALDALFGSPPRSAATISAGVQQYAGAVPNVTDKIRLLTYIRNELMHGGVTTIEQSQHYLAFIDQFDEDPHISQRSLLRTCILNLVP